MENVEKEIRDIFATHGGPPDVERWFQQPCPTFNNKTPRFVIDSGNGPKLLNKIRGIYQMPRHKVKVSIETPSEIEEVEV